MNTLLVTVVLANLFTILMLGAFRRRHGKDKPVRTFLLAKALQTIAWCLFALRGSVPAISLIVLSNSFLLFGYSMELAAVLIFMGRYSGNVRRFYKWFSIIGIAGFDLVAIAGQPEFIRVIYASLLDAVLVIPPACALWQYRKSSNVKSVLGVLYFLVGVSLAARAVSASITRGSVQLYEPGLYQTTSFLSTYLVLLLGNTGFILLLKEGADDELIRLASVDDLTGIMNRRTFNREASKRLVSHAYGRKPLSLLLFDIDKFKEINDGSGHDAGDRVLKEITDTVSGQLGAEDLFARFGGDEFVILLAEANEETAEKVAERIRSAVERQGGEGEGDNDGRLPCTISIGVVTVVPARGTQLETVYKTGDQALYQAKREGRNRFVRREMA